MTRGENWDVSLVEWSNTVTGLPFKWGRTDCASLVRLGSRVVYGKRALVGVPRYTSEDSARAVMEGMGDARAFLKAAGAKKLKLGFAQAGDILVMPGLDNGIPRLALVVYSGHALTSDPKNGVRILKLEQLRRRTSAWRLHSE